MNRLTKFALIGAGAALGVILLVFIGANLYLQSGDVQQRIRLGAEKALGYPVAIRRTLILPWSGLTLSGISVANPALDAVNLAEAARFSARFELLPLLNRRLVLREIRLTRPEIALRQGADGKWVPDRTEPPPPLVADVPPDVPPDVRPPKPAKAPGYTVELRRITMRDGSATFADQRGRPVAKIENIDFDGRLTEAGVLEGDLTALELGFFGRIFPKKLRAHIVAGRDGVEISNVKAALAGGRMRATFKFSGGAGGQPRFEVFAMLDEVSVPRLIADAGGNERGTGGLLGGEMRLAGDPRDGATISGVGHLALIEGRLQPLDFVRQIGNLLRIDELLMLDLHRADLEFEVRDERVWVDELVLKTENFIITAEGPVDFRGELDLEGRFLVSEKIQRELRGLLSDKFEPSEDADYKQIAFRVDGTLDRPRTDLIDQVAGRQIGNFLGLIEGFITPRNVPEPNQPTKDSRPDESPES